MKYWTKTSLLDPRRPAISRWCNDMFGYNGWMAEPQYGMIPEECYLKWMFWYESDLVCFQLAWEEANHTHDY